MRNQLLPEVQDLIKKTEEASERSIEIIENGALDSFIHIEISQGPNKPHQFFIRRYEDFINHLIAHEAAHIFRLFSVPAEDRKIPFSSQLTESKAHKVLRPQAEKFFGEDTDKKQFAGALEMWYQGLVRQITSFPGDIRVEKWLYNNLPSVRQFQLDSLEQHYSQVSKALKDDKIKRNTIPFVYEASQLMNYAFFRTLGLTMNQNWVKAFSSTSFTERGKELSAFDGKGLTEDWNGDRKCIENWAKYLGMEGWFDWMNFEDVPETPPVQG